MYLLVQNRKKGIYILCYLLPWRTPNPDDTLGRMHVLCLSKLPGQDVKQCSEKCKYIYTILFLNTQGKIHIKFSNTVEWYCQAQKEKTTRIFPSKSFSVYVLSVFLHMQPYALWQVYFSLSLTYSHSRLWGGNSVSKGQEHKVNYQ